MKTNQRHSLIPASYVLYRPQAQKLLLGLRQNTGYEDGLFSLPAGHVESGEGPLLAALREFEEETGIELEPSDLKLIHIAYRKLKDEPERIDFYFLCDKDKGQAEVKEPHKCAKWQLFDEGDLPTPVSYHVKAILKALQDRHSFLESGD